MRRYHRKYLNYGITLTATNLSNIIFMNGRSSFGTSGTVLFNINIESQQHNLNGIIRKEFVQRLP